MNRNREYVIATQVTGSALRKHSMSHQSIKTSIEGTERLHASKKILRSMRRRAREFGLGERRLSRDQVYLERAVLRFDVPIKRGFLVDRILDRQRIKSLREEAS